MQGKCFRGEKGFTDALMQWSRVWVHKIVWENLLNHTSITACFRNLVEVQDFSFNCAVKWYVCHTLRTAGVVELESCTFCLRQGLSSDHEEQPKGQIYTIYASQFQGEWHHGTQMQGSHANSLLKKWAFTALLEGWGRKIASSGPAWGS